MVQARGLSNSFSQFPQEKQVDFCRYVTVENSGEIKSGDIGGHSIGPLHPIKLFIQIIRI